MKPGTPPLQSTRLLDQVRERIRYMHYSLSTEQVYLYWVRFFIRWSGRSGQMLHPRDIGAPGVEAFLSMLATERKVSASTHNQALSALLFLYREVLCISLPWLDDIRWGRRLSATASGRLLPPAAWPIPQNAFLLLANSFGEWLQTTFKSHAQSVPRTADSRRDHHRPLSIAGFSRGKQASKRR